MKAFCGRGDSWEPFWDNFLVLASIQGLGTTEKQIKHFPLFLDGDAFLAYSKMSDAVRQKMVESFSLMRLSAYRAFITRRLCVDESPDAYVTDLQHLAALSGNQSTEPDKDAMMIKQLEAGLPSRFACELRLTPDDRPEVDG